MYFGRRLDVTNVTQKKRNFFLRINSTHSINGIETVRARALFSNHFLKQAGFEWNETGSIEERQAHTQNSISK